MLPFMLHVATKRIIAIVIANSSVDYGYAGHYAYYQRFRRREKRLTSNKKFPTHRQKRTWWWVF